MAFLNSGFSGVIPCEDAAARTSGALPFSPCAKREQTF